MHSDIERINKTEFMYDEYVPLPEGWTPPEQWNPDWKVRLRVNFDENENVLERMVSIHTQEGEILMYEFQTRSDPTDLLDEYPPEVDQIVYQCQIVLADSLRGKNLALPFWIMSEIILIDTDPKKQRLIIDLSGNGWTQRRMPEYYSTLQKHFPNLAKIFEYDQDGMYFVIYDFDKSN